jgi:prolyl-tRNA editing enzyme YbaK/EbsC (Cys-tRNA(Pro) deacylase)
MKIAKKITEKIDTLKDSFWHRYGEKLTEAIAQRVLKSLGGARGLEATITDRLAGIAAEHSEITAEDIAEALGFTEHDIAQEVCLHSLAESLHMEDIARALRDYIDHEVIAENIDISDVASNLDFDSLATRIDPDTLVQSLAIDFDLNGLALAVLRLVAVDAVKAADKKGAA